MASTPLTGPPTLSTPDSRILEERPDLPPDNHVVRFSEEELYTTYEIERTIKEIRQGKWKRIALQFPDQMLRDSPRVFDALSRGVSGTEDANPGLSTPTPPAEATDSDTANEAKSQATSLEKLTITENDTLEAEPRLCILGDTSYGACCVDEIAAEHMDADVVVHYGRACLSPTARLPVIYVFTHPPLEIKLVVKSFKQVYPDLSEKVVLMADVRYAHHISNFHQTLLAEGYMNVFATSVIHDPSSPLPNRTVPEAVKSGAEDLHDHHLFHISDPPKSLLLTLSSRVASIHIYPTGTSGANLAFPTALSVSSRLALRRRYAMVTALSSASVFGILINTLSVKNYLPMVEQVRREIDEVGKKAYTFVVGKINAAKVANFSEVDGWVVIGCWESSLVEDEDGAFWKPIITPFELSLALRPDAERVWTGQWTGNFNDLLLQGSKTKSSSDARNSDVVNSGLAKDTMDTPPEASTETIQGQSDSEPESAPPEFDLRHGRYVTGSQAMQIPSAQLGQSDDPSHGTITRRANGDLTRVGAFSAGADFLQTRRTWKGLGSDYEIAYEQDGREVPLRGAAVEEGRAGIARGYNVGEEKGERR